VTGRGTRVAGVALVVALVSCVGLASIARANTYKLSGSLVQRQAPSGNFDYGYRGPQFNVSFLGTSSDTYVCPVIPTIGPSSVSNWVVVGDIADSADRDFSASSTGSGHQINIDVVDWSLKTVYLRAAISCTTSPSEFPYNPPNCIDDPTNCFYPPGVYLPFWYGVFKAGQPGVTQYAELVKRAFCWSSTYPGCATGAPKPTRRFALHNGTDTIDLTFRDLNGARPPAIRLVGAANCTVRRMAVAVENGAGHLRLVLGCRRLTRSAAVRVRFVNPVRRDFRLRRGNGSIRVRLSKPPGTAQPLVYLTYGRANKCRNVVTRLRVGSRTFDLRVNARCGRVAGSAMAHLYIGGLLR
jgi:hypothetical protein